MIAFSATDRTPFDIYHYWGHSAYVKRVHLKHVSILQTSCLNKKFYCYCLLSCLGITLKVWKRYVESIALCRHIENYSFSYLVYHRLRHRIRNTSSFLHPLNRVLVHRPLTICNTSWNSWYFGGNREFEYTYKFSKFNSWNIRDKKAFVFPRPLGPQRERGMNLVIISFFSLAMCFSKVHVFLRQRFVLLKQYYRYINVKKYDINNIQ